MTNLLPTIQLANDVPVTTSFDVATFFEKQHKDVLEKIKILLKQIDTNFTERNFPLSHQKQNIGQGEKTTPMYYLTRDGFTLLAMGFTGKKAMQFKIAYIEAFNRMEEELRKKCHQLPNSHQLTNSTQRKPLANLVKIFASKSGFSFAEAWTMLNSKFGIDTISELPSDKLQEAIDYVENQIASYTPQVFPSPLEYEEVRKRLRQEVLENSRKDVVDFVRTISTAYVMEIDLYLSYAEKIHEILQKKQRENLHYIEEKLAQIIR